MGKALLIRDADFSVNKLDTVEIGTPVPCTGLTLSASTGTMQKVGSTLTLTATVTPADTTDAVLWATSDANVAEVAAGVVTQKGVGTVTITATCGEETASCVFTCTQAYASFDLTCDTGGGLIMASGHNNLALQSNTRYMRVVLAASADGGYQAATNTDPSVYAIPIPYGSTTVTIGLPATTGTSAGNISTFNRNYLDNFDKQTSVANVDAAKALKSVSDVAGGGSPTLPTGLTSFTINLADEAPEGANAMMFNLVATNGSAASAWTGTVTVTFA